MSKSSQARWADQFPDFGQGPLSTEPYISQAYFERECDRIFSSHWLCVGRAAEIEKPGSYFVRDLPMIPASLIVMRTSQGGVQAFHNVCRHRGNRLLDGQGQAGRIVCDYHGWTYQNDGSLIAVPDEDQFVGLDKYTCGLKTVHTQLWQDFVFVNLSIEPKESLSDFLGELGENLGSFPFGEMTQAYRYRVELKTNWKTAMDIGREGYHIRIVHQGTAPDSHSGGDNPFSHLPYVNFFGAHAANSLAGNPEHKPSPAEALVIKFAPTVIQSGEDLSDKPACLNPGGANHWAFDANFIFPNFGIILGPGFCSTDLFIPVRVDRTIWEQTLYAQKPRTAGERISLEFSSVLARDLVREDWSQVEKIQAGLSTGALDEVNLSDQEILIRHAYKTVDDLVSN